MTCRVAESVDTKMPINNLARVFGPTIVGVPMSDSEPANIAVDTRNIHRSHKVLKISQNNP